MSSANNKVLQLFTQIERSFTYNKNGPIIDCEYVIYSCFETLLLLYLTYCIPFER